MSLGLEMHGYHVLVNHQLAKLESATTVDTLFVGDSSLGNAISEKVWNQHREGGALNMALVGFLGYSGSFHMARQTIATTKPKNIVIMHNVLLSTYEEHSEVFGALTVSDGWFNTGHSSIDLARVWLTVYFNYRTLRKNIRRLYHHYMGIDGPKGQVIADDYIEQANPLDPIRERTRIEGATPVGLPSMNKGHFIYLKQLADLCSEQQINCIYVHGPIFQAMCKETTKYVLEVNRHILKTGLKLLSPTPVCFTDKELGDSHDHVRPELKGEFTLRYLEILSPHLSATRSDQ